MVYAVALALCVALRLLPHPANLTPLGASAVFAGRTLPVRWALPVTWLGMLLANVGLAFWRGYAFWDGAMAFVFVGFGLQVALGYLFRKVKGGAFLAAAAGGVGFYLVSNLGVWLASGMYPHNAAGLGACYAAALPFLGRTLGGDLLWTLALTPVYRWAQKRTAARGWPGSEAAAAG